MRVLVRMWVSCTNNSRVLSLVCDHNGLRELAIGVQVLLLYFRERLGVIYEQVGLNVS